MKNRLSFLQIILIDIVLVLMFLAMLYMFGVFRVYQGKIILRWDWVPTLIGALVALFSALNAFNAFAFKYLFRGNAFIKIVRCYKTRTSKSHNILVIELIVINETSSNLKINEVAVKGYYQEFNTFPPVSQGHSRRIEINMIDQPEIDKKLSIRNRMKLRFNYSLWDSTKNYVKILSVKV